MLAGAGRRVAASQLEEQVVLTLLDLANHLQKRGERIARRGALTAQQWLLLLQVAGDPNFPGSTCTRAGVGGPVASAIAEARGVSRANISGLLRSLLRRGLVRQVEHRDDRRRRGLVITPRGRRALRTIEPVRRRANGLLLARVPEPERERFLGVLRTCLQTVVEEREEAYL